MRDREAAGRVQQQPEKEGDDYLDRVKLAAYNEVIRWRGEKQNELKKIIRIQQNIKDHVEYLKKIAETSLELDKVKIQR